MEVNRNNIDVLEISEHYNSTVCAILFDFFKNFESNSTNQINVALSGGTTPLPILHLLKNKNINWQRFNFYLVDERYVEKDHPESNFGNLSKSFFNHISSKVYPMVQHATNIDEDEQAYNQLLKEIAQKKGDTYPQFDLVLLGLGDDGHTASLFPGTKALDENEKCVVRNEVPQLNSQRITLTYPVLLNAKEIVVLAKGELKKGIIRNLYSDTPENYPMLKIVQNHNNLKWLLGI